MHQLRTGEIIRALRKNKGITQEQLAEILGISPAAVSKWESGITSPDIQMFPILARLFHVSIDFLMGFTHAASQEEREQIYNEVTDRFQVENLDECIDIWEYYIRQYPTDYEMQYDLTNIVSLNMAKLISKGEDGLASLTMRLIKVYRQCTASDDLRIKQGSYFQLSNLYISLQNYELAQESLSHIPVLEVNPQLLLNMIYVNKGEHSIAEQKIQESILRAINEIVGELGHLIVIKQKENDFDSALLLYGKQKQLLDIFELIPFQGIGVILQRALLMCSLGKTDEALCELDNLALLLVQNTERKSICNIPFFSSINDQNSSSNFNAMKPTLFMLLTNCLSQIDDSVKSQEIMQHFTPFLS